MKKKDAGALQDEAFIEEARGHAGNLRHVASREMEPPQNAEQSLMAVPAEAIPVNVPLPCTVYMKSGEKFLVFRRQGEKVNYKTALGNQKKNNDTLYIHKAFWQIFMDSLEHLKLPENANAMAKAMHMRHLLLAYGEELEKRLKEPQKPTFEKLEKFAMELSKTIQADPAAGIQLLKKCDDPLMYFVNHSVNTAIYATLIALKFRVSPQDIQHLTYAALVHDVGNLFLPKRILYKRSSLSPDEEILIRQHPRKGAEFLISIGAHGSVVQAVVHHHEQIDGTGYPDKLKGKEIPLFSKIISIADVFEALTSDRPYQKAISSAEALEKMAEMEGKFDPQILQFMADHKAEPEKNKE